jgi:hypothetical protein
MPDEAREQKALADRILGSKLFRAAPGQRNLLNFLLANRDFALSAAVIEEKHFKRPIHGDKHNQAHARERLDDLKHRLKKYTESAPGEPWICALPDATGVGYRLEFRKASTTQTHAEKLWHPHLVLAKEILVICSSHVFFYDRDARYVRVPHINERSQRDDALNSLSIEHPELYKDTLERSFEFLPNGESLAFEGLQKWFHSHSGILISRCMSREILDTQFHKASPILLGGSSTNRFISGILDEARRQDLLRYDSTEVSGGIKLCGETPEHGFPKDFEVTDSILKPSSKNDVVFVIVTRLPHPSGLGPVTIISADQYAKAISQVASLLTDDESAGRLFEAMELPTGADLPDYFQMLFGVTKSPGSFEGEGRPVLLDWSPLAANSGKR